MALQFDHICAGPPIHDAVRNTPNLASFRTSPELIRVLHAYAFSVRDAGRFLETSLFKIRLLLNLTWEELRTTICPLLASFSQDQGGVHDLLIFVTHPSRFRMFGARCTLETLVRNSTKILKQVLSGELPWHFGQVFLHST
jgi:hypothetical protein